MVQSAAITTDWLNAMFASAWSFLPTAWDTSATVATLSTWVSASAMKNTVPAELTAAMATSPSFATK